MIRFFLIRVAQLSAVAVALYAFVLFRGEQPVELPWINGPIPAPSSDFTPPPEHGYTCTEGGMAVDVSPDNDPMRDWAAWKCEQPFPPLDIELPDIQPTR